MKMWTNATTRHRHLRATAILLLLFFSIPAVADEDPFKHFYIGLAAGYARGFDGCDAFPSDYTVTKCSDRDIGGKIFMGFQFNRNWGLEMGVLSLGYAEANGDFLGLQSDGDAFAGGVEFSGTGTLPLSEKIGLFGKVGILWWRVESNLIYEYTTVDEGVSPAVGAGINYDIIDWIGVRGEWQRFFAVGGSSTTGEADMDLFSVGVVFRF